MKRFVCSILCLVMVLGLAACSRNKAPTVTPSNTPVPSQSQTIDDGTPSRNEGNENGVLGEIGEDMGNAMDDMGNAVGDTARGIGNTVKKAMR